MKLEKRAVFGWGPSGAGSANPRNGIAVHYDGSNQSLANKQHASCRTYWKNTRKFHMGPSRGWADIGYSFAVCPHGYVLEGRGLNKQQAAQPGGNSTWYSVTFMSGPKEAPTIAQIAAFRELRAWLRGKGVASAIRPHSAFTSTSCCGDILRRLISNGTLAKGVPSTPKPGVPKPSAPAQEDDVTPQDIDKIAAAVVKKAYNSRGHTVGQALQVAKDGTEKLLAAAGQQVDVDEAAIVRGVLTGLSPTALAAAVVEALPPELAEQVLDGLRTRLEA